ncbi:MAG: porin [Verrucomicrobiota bacterium]
MTQRNKLTRLVAKSGAALLLAGGFAVAGDAGSAKSVSFDDKNPVEPAWSPCDLYDLTTLYSNSDNPFIQKVKLQGRYHGQYEHIDVDGGPFTDDASWNHRRFRLGAKIDLLNNMQFAFNYNVANGRQFTQGDFIDGLEDMTLKIKPSFVDSVTLGKMKNKITREESISSNDIKTLERSHFVNSYNAGRPWGVEVGQEAFGLKHAFGLFTGGAYDNDGMQSRFPNFENGGLMATYRAEKDLGDASLHFDYQYSDWTGRDNVSRYLGSNARNLFALGYVKEGDLGGLLVDLMYADDIRQAAGNAALDSGAFGLTILPHYNITDNLELVGRYAYASQVDDENPFDNVRGTNSDWVQDLHTFYVGLNYYICGSNLKTMLGYEYATGESIRNGGTDYNAGAFSFAVRTKW